MKTWIGTCTKDYGDTFFNVEVEADTYTSAFVKIMEIYDEGKRDFAIVHLEEKSK